MAITNFIPEIWDARLLSTLRSVLVFGQPGVTNRDYEGDIAQFGDTVNITSVVDVDVDDYDADAVMTYPGLTDETRALTITQKKKYSFSVDDVERRQAMPGYVEEATRSAAYNLSKAVDTYVSGLMSAGVDSGNVLAEAALDTDYVAYDMLVELRTLLTRDDCPEQGRFVVVQPEVYAKLLRDDRFVRADASGTTEGLRNGHVGRAAGFDVIESNTAPFTPADSGTSTPAKYTVIAGHSMATTLADQLLKSEALRLESAFKDGVRGLHVYGGKVIRPTLLAKQTVTLA